MKNGVSTFLGLLIIFVVFISTAKADGLKEGKWSMTMVTTMDNVSPEMAAAMKEKMANIPPGAAAMMQQSGIQINGNGQGMTMTITRCVTNENPVPKIEGRDNCQQTHEIVGNTVSFHSTCGRNGIQMETTGSMTYSGDSMQGQIKTNRVESGNAMGSTINITGQYLGPCS